MLLLALPIIILCLGTCFPPKDKNQHRANTYIFLFLCCLAVTLFVGLRSRHVGSLDTNAYAGFFEGVRNASLFSTLKNSEITNFREFLTGEGIFTLLMWGTAQVFSNAQIFIFITSLIITICTGIFIHKHSDDPLFSWIAYICLGLMTFNMNGMRQALAMSICLLAYGFAKRRQFVRFLLIVLLAFMFHRTAFVFLIVYPLCNYKPSLIKNTIFVSLSGTFLIFSRQIAAIYDSWAGKDYASGESFDGGGFTVVSIYILLLVLSALYIHYSDKDHPERDNITALSTLLIVGFIFYISRYLSTQIFERASYYFFYFSILLFPKLSNTFDKESRPLYKMIAIVLAVVLFGYRLIGGPMSNYIFFWQA